MDVETNDKLKKAKLENGFYNIIDGKRVSAGKTLSVVNPATGKQLAIVPDVGERQKVGGRAILVVWRDG
jgi:hypothetical protein